MRSKRLFGFVGIAVLCVAVSVGCTGQGQNSSSPSPSPSSSSPSPGAALVGEWVAPGDSDVTLTLDADGTMVGFDGCNTHSGTWSGPNGGAIHLDFTAGTEAGCPKGVVAWLAVSDGAMVRGDSLALFGPTDVPTGDLVKSEE